MLNAGTFDKLSTSCIKLVTCSSSEESSIVMLFGKYGSVVAEFRWSLSRALSKIGAVLRFSRDCKNGNRSFELPFAEKEIARLRRQFDVLRL